MAGLARVADVLVVGLGAAGAATAWRLAERGHDVVGVDRFDTPHDQGATHGRTRIVRTTSFESDDYVPLGIRALDLWHELETVSARRVLHPTGLLLLGAPDSRMVRTAVDQADRFALAIASLDHDQLCRTYPQLRTATGTVAVEEQHAGLVSPELAVRLMVDRAAHLGATIQTPRAVSSIDTQCNPALVRFADGEELRVRHVVLAVGAWLGDIEVSSRSLQVQRMVVPWFDRLEWIASGPSLPAFIHERGEGATPMGGMPGLPGDPQFKIMALVATEAPSIAAVERAVSRQQYAAVEEYVRTHHVYLNPHSTGGQVCVTLDAPDGDPVVGPHPRRSNLSLIGALSGHGFKFAPAFAEMVCDHIDGSSAARIPFICPDRFSDWSAAHDPLLLDISELENT
ncbi:N-methyl-L-tryptophan oxidase [Nocardioides terrisoli]|uniref:N-methyl-L-tryptophan oxidase n=1 Tax=Nocardioides terrisoli TaxID=3388267 RepID=UPI00287B6AAC|nr:N-methyl-L-tryptophan oxidase [Nocardioides marmorisolisilvae]